MADSDSPEQVEQQVNQSFEQSVSEQVEQSVSVPVALTLSRNPSGKKTDDELELALFALVDEGVTPREAARQLGLNLRTAYNLMARSEESLEALRGATRRLMARNALDRIEDWRVASEVGARKKGNHAPARDWLLHAGVIDAVDNGNVSVRVAINIGTEDRPMHVASPQDVVVEVPPEKG